MKKYLRATGVLALTMAISPFLSGCTENSSAPKEITEEDRASSYYQELLYNYRLLNVGYYDAHLKNELNSNPDVYFKVLFSADYTKGACTARYADVCGMYNQMSDPFTRYFDPNFAEGIFEYLIQTEEIFGLGAEVGEDLIVTEVYPNGPAHFAGLQAGDKILAVNGSKVYSLAAYEKAASGKSQDIVKIVYNRDGVEYSTGVLLDKFKAPSVHLTYESGIPVITIDEFTDITINENGTYEEFHEYLRKVVDSGAQSLIIDLRDNGGGTTEHCLQTSAEFLTDGQTMVNFVSTNLESFIKGENAETQRFDTTSYKAYFDGIGRDLYVVFLANEYTASCSELMIAAVAANKATPVVGTTTYGKGIGQIYYVTSSEALYGITYSHVFDKDFKNYHGYGIVPDHIISDPDKQMAKAVEIATLRTEQRTAGYGSIPTGNFEKSAADGGSESKVLNRDYVRRGAGLVTLQK